RSTPAAAPCSNGAGASSAPSAWPPARRRRCRRRAPRRWPTWSGWRRPCPRTAATRRTSRRWPRSRRTCGWRRSRRTGTAPLVRLAAAMREDGGDQEDEQALAEIEEYVRVAALLLHGDCALGPRHRGRLN